MQGIIYTRVSSDEQIKGTSLEFQEELCRQYCKQKGIEVVAVFCEQGESAKDLSLNNRQKFLEALEFCHKHKNKIQAFVVLRVDRFSRNTEDHFAVRKILLDYGTALHSVTEPIGNKPAEKFIETVLAGAAEYDNAIRKQRCVDGMMSRINQGIYPWKPPIGYKCQHTRKHGEKKNQPDPTDERTFSIIQRGLKEFAKGMHSQSALAKLMDQWGLKDIRQRKTTPQFINQIMDRSLKFYSGIIINPWTKEEKQGLHQPMINRSEMLQIQLIRSGKKKMAKYDRYNPDFPLRRTMICSACNWPLTGSTPRGRGGKYHYYHCHHKNCIYYAKAIPKEKLEKEFAAYLQQITPKKKFFTVLKETVMDLWNGVGSKYELLVRQIEHQLSMLEAKRKRIFEMREEGSYDKEEFVERKKAVDNEIASVQSSLDSTRFDDFDIEKALSYAIDFISDLAKQWLEIPFHLRPRFQKLIFPDGIPYDRKKGIGTPKLGYIYELNQKFIDSKSSMVHFIKTDWNNIIEELKKWQELREEMEAENEEMINAA